MRSGEPAAPLEGKRVVVTRAETQARHLIDGLTDLGAGVVEMPVIAIQEPPDGGAALRSSLKGLAGGSYEWTIFTSWNAARAVLSELDGPGAFGRTRVAAIGRSTQAALNAWGAHVDLVPSAGTSEGLLACMLAPPGDGSHRILLPSAEEARPLLRAGLEQDGWEVDPVTAYRTVTVQPPPEALAQAASADAICFTSGSTVRGYLACAGEGVMPAVVVCIGPVTAMAAEHEGITVTAIAGRPSVDGILDCLVSSLAEGSASRR